jgi:hypothetical protein
MPFLDLRRGFAFELLGNSPHPPFEHLLPRGEGFITFPRWGKVDRVSETDEGAGGFTFSRGRRFCRNVLQ